MRWQEFVALLEASSAAVSPELQSALETLQVLRLLLKQIYN